MIGEYRLGINEVPRRKKIKGSLVAGGKWNYLVLDSKHLQDCSIDYSRTWLPHHYHRVVANPPNEGADYSFHSEDEETFSTRKLGA